jgi:hypothetical protein
LFPSQQKFGPDKTGPMVDCANTVVPAARAADRFDQAEQAAHSFCRIEFGRCGRWPKV